MTADISRVCSIECGCKAKASTAVNCGWPSSPHHSRALRSEMPPILPPIRLSAYPLRASESV
jgi:hypothetical protein